LSRAQAKDLRAPWPRRLALMLRPFTSAQAVPTVPRQASTAAVTSKATRQDDTGPDLLRERKGGTPPPAEEVTFYEVLDHALFGPELAVNVLQGHYPLSAAL